jgi:hypothetical protein
VRSHFVTCLFADIYFQRCVSAYEELSEVARQPARSVDFVQTPPPDSDDDEEGCAPASSAFEEDVRQLHTRLFQSDHSH